MKIIADTHTHTLADDHAFSTITENAKAAAERGLKFLCMTDHAPAMPGSSTKMHFLNPKSPPRFIYDVMILKGCEANIIDYNGGLDLSPRILNQLEWVIASMHTNTLEMSDEKLHTRAWMKIAENPSVDVAGHIGDPRFHFEYKTVIKAFAETGKIIEINNHSLIGGRQSRQQCREIAILCAEYGVPVVVSTDAHFHSSIGHFEASLEMLEEIGFPEDQVLNADYDRFLALVREKSGKVLTDGK